MFSHTCDVKQDKNMEVANDGKSLSRDDKNKISKETKVWGREK